MDKRVQIQLEFSHKILYHQGLIKLLVSFALEEFEMTWGYFLKSVGLKEEEQVPNSQNEGDESKDKTYFKVSPEPSVVGKSAYRQVDRPLRLDLNPRQKNA